MTHLASDSSSSGPAIIDCELHICSWEKPLSPRTSDSEHNSDLCYVCPQSCQGVVPHALGVLWWHPSGFSSSYPTCYCTRDRDLSRVLLWEAPSQTLLKELTLARSVPQRLPHRAGEAPVAGNTDTSKPDQCGFSSADGMLPFTNCVASLVVSLSFQQG